jgi:hypothetical protein
VARSHALGVVATSARSIRRCGDDSETARITIEECNQKRWQEFADNFAQEFDSTKNSSQEFQWSVDPQQRLWSPLGIMIV